MAHDDPVAGLTVDADWAYDLSRATSYTPALTAGTNPNLGADGTITGWYHQNGHWISGGVLIAFSGSGTSAGSGDYRISLPFAADASLMVGSATGATGDIVGGAQLRDVSAGLVDVGVVSLVDAANGLVQINAEGTGMVADGTPWTWTIGDRIALNFAYVADPSAL